MTQQQHPTPDEIFAQAVAINDDIVARNGGYLTAEQLPTGLTPESDTVLWIPNRGAPAFQFANRQVVPVVAYANRHLLASEDPHGVASWWLRGHGGLRDGVAPFTLVGKQDDVLRELVDSELADDE